MQFDNNTSAVVTGGASGLGRASAEALAANGIKVTIFDLNEEKGEEIAKDLTGMPVHEIEKLLTGGQAHAG